MTAFLLPSFRLLLGLLTLTVLVACGSDETKKKKSDKIDTEHLYYSNNNIYSFEPGSGNSKTGKSIKRASYNEGTLPVKLNTNEDKQGYEFVAFVQGNDKRKIKLLNYKNMKISTIATLDSSTSKVCGLYPRELASEDSFKSSERVIHHDSSLILETSATGTCTDSLVLLLDFKISSGGNIKDNGSVDNDTNTTILNQSTNANELLAQPDKQAELGGELLIDYTHTVSNINNRIVGRFASFGVNNNINDQAPQLIYYDDDYDIKWQLPLGSAGERLRVTQFNNAKILASVGKNLYIKEVEDIIEASDVDASKLPSSGDFNTLFDTPEQHKLSQFDYEIASNKTELLIKDGQKLVLFDVSKDIAVSKTIFDGAQRVNLESFTFALTDNGTTVVQLINSDKTALGFIPPYDDDTPPLIGPDNTLNNIQHVFIKGNQVFVNTFIAPAENGQPTNFLEAEATAYFIDLDGSDSNYELTVFENSQFIETSDTRNTSPKILLLSSDVDSANNVKRPKLYKFDADEENGRKQVRSDEKGNKVKIDFSYGKLLGNKDMSGLNSGEELLSEIYLDSITGSITDDIHGQLKVDTAIEFLDDDNNVTYRRVSDLYFFKPDQSKPDNDDLSLRYIITHNN